ncbi:hypothetical protein I4F81_004982 [Pyropia yezoensis]|uniref:Uncharacterized protein n=1 Tax=Pyropia yezoensis TaxID=2788 RepID=A0ACC3BXR4_PYRYE|nr:hypothetical protein I4F81_004982 [Neopyropia yezoensis]|eukprot:contig_19049_g4705
MTTRFLFLRIYKQISSFSRHHRASLRAHLLSCTKFKAKNVSEYNRLVGATVFTDGMRRESASQGVGADVGAHADRLGASSATGARSLSSSVAPANAFYMSMSAAHTEAGNIAHAEAVFAAGGKFGYCTDEEEWGTSWNKLIGTEWRPPSRSVISSKYLDAVFLKVDETVRAVLRSVVGGCFQCDGWTDPNVAQVFSSLYGAPLPFYLSSFRVAGRRETADVLVEKVKEQMELVSPFRGDSWRERSNTAFVLDANNINRSARKKLLEAGVFSFAAITTALIKAKQKVIDMDFSPSLFDEVMDTTNWDGVLIWEPVIRTVAFITDYL